MEQARGEHLEFVLDFFRIEDVAPQAGFFRRQQSQRREMGRGAGLG